MSATQRPITTHRKLAEITRIKQEETERINQQLHLISEQANQRIIQLNQQLDQQRRRTDQSLQGHSQNFGRIKIKQADELEAFKTKINLVEYALNEGYQVDSIKSSENYIVMTGKSGDTILVGVDGGDGHFFYYSMRDAQDKGSIIDFIQKRQHLNLGEVRKKLRPWIKDIYEPNPKIPLPTPTQDRAAAIAQLAKQNPVQKPHDFELGG